MKKLTIIIGLMVLMAMGVTALNEGDTYTQSQIDSLNMDTMPISFTYLSIGYQGNNMFGYNWFLHIRPTGSNVYTVYKQSINIPSVTVSDYNVCKGDTSLTDTECLNYAKYTYIVNKAKRKTLIRNMLKELQTQPAQDMPGSLI